MPDADYERLAPHLEWFELPVGKVVAEHGDRVSHVYFPTDGIVSLLATLEDQASSVEVAIVGYEGMVGTSLLLEGTDARPQRRSVVETAGHSYRIRAEILMAEFERRGKLRYWLLRYTQALITQIAQVSVCPTYHKLEAQLCRWLLLRLDRLATGELYVSHEEIASRLGASPDGVEAAALHLQETGLIRYGRGHLVVLDRAGIERRACDCLAVIQKEYARLLGA